MSQTLNTPTGDFDFFTGSWRVHHRQLIQQLAGCTEWEEFPGTTVFHQILGGHGNFDDNELALPAGAYRAVTLRAFDPTQKLWSIWWLDGRNPMRVGPPTVGRFHDGIGTFYRDDTLCRKPIRVRFLWSHITPNSCRWARAYSDDSGGSWETNWTMDFTRTA